MISYVAGSLTLHIHTCAPMRPFAADEDKDEIMTVESLQMDFETIRVATNDFSDANKLGQGGFGHVYLVRNQIVQF